MMTTETEMKTYALYGDTYRHRDLIKKLGGKWDSQKRIWLLQSAIPPEIGKGIQWVEHDGEFKHRCEKCGMEFDMPGYAGPANIGCVYCA